MREIDAIVIHCSYTPPSMDIGVREIYDWHVNDNGWKDIGYHYVIRRNGNIEIGRPEHTPGAHVAGHNHNTIGLCLVGGQSQTGRNPSNFTKEQYLSLNKLIDDLKSRYPKVKIRGHRSYNPGKLCPQFDTEAYFENYEFDRARDS